VSPPGFLNELRGNENGSSRGRKPLKRSFQAGGFENEAYERKRNTKVFFDRRMREKL
jgi:hypothetical protein